MSPDRMLLRKARRDLRRRRAQFVAVAVTVGCGLALFASTYDAYRNLESSYREVYDDLAFADLWVTGGDTTKVAAAAEGDPGVGAVTTRLEGDAPLQLGRTRLQGRVTSIPSGHQPAVNRLLITAGHYPTRHDEVLVEQHAADEFHLTAGDRIGVLVDGRPVEVDVVGVAASAEYLWLARSRNEVITPRDDFAVVFAVQPLAEQVIPDAPGQVVLTATDPRAVDRMRRVAEATGAVDVYDRDQQASNSTLQLDVAGFGELAVLFPLLFLTAAGLGAFVVLGRLVQTDRHVIGALTANGIGRRTVQRHYATHAAVAVFAGAIPGLLAGSVLGRVMTGLYTAELDIPVTATRLRPLTPLIGLGFALVTTVIVAVVPVRAAARVLPAEALRPPAPPGVARSAVERIVPRRLPAGALVALRNLVRRPRRAITVAAGVVLAAVVVVASAGMGDSMRATLDEEFGTVDTRDLTAVMAGPADGPTVARLRAVPGVAVAEPAGMTQARLSSGQSSASVELQLVAPGTRLHDFGKRYDHGLVLAKATADDLGASVGDAVELTAGADHARVPVAAVVREPLGDFAYLDIDSWQRMGGAAPTGVSMAVAEGGDVTAVRSALAARRDVLAVVDHAALRNVTRDLLGLFDLFTGLMVVFGVVLAASLVFNAVTVNVGERTTELTTLRAAGIGRRRLHRWVLGETSVVVGLALVPGLVLGGLLSGQFLRTIDTGVFHIDQHVATTTWAWITCLLVGVALLAHVPAFRRLDRLDLAATVRERQT